MQHSPRRSRLAALGAALAAGSLALCAAPASAVNGTPVSDADTTYAYTAQITVGPHDRGCSAVLVDTEWLMTAASCFAADPAVSLAVPAGAPAKNTTAVIGRADLGGTQGAERRVVQLVPRTDRDVVLARLNRPVTNVTPIALATTAPVTGEELKFSGHGRSKTEWAPLRLHTGAFTVDSAATTTATVTGKDSAACGGDAGGPVVRSGKLAGLVSQTSAGGCYGIDPAVTSTTGVMARVDDLASWVSSTVGATRITDFNGDGAEDIAIGDPAATVGTVTSAGLVRISYGGGKGTAEINQDLDWVAGGAEQSDWFGEQLATVDYNEDGYTDLVVGTPNEAVGTATDAGFVDVLYGAPGGLGSGTLKSTHYEQGAGSGAIKASASEAGDRMGHAVAAATTRAGEPYLLIGNPGEALGTVKTAGSAFYVTNSTSVAVHQDKTGVPGASEEGDRFGASLAANANHAVIGSPSEAIGADKEAGGLAVFDPNKLNAENSPTPLFGLDQDLDGISGGAEAGDDFAASLALTAYRHTAAATGATDSMLAIGSPGEALSVDGGATQRADAGSVALVRIKADGTWDQTGSLWQGTGDDDVVGTAEAGDRMGERVTAVNTAPRAVGTAATLRIAVGTPNEAVGTAAKAGAIHTFSLLGTPGANDKWIEAGDGDGIPGTAGADQYLGRSIHLTGTKLYAGMPYGPSSQGALYALPMSNVTAGGAIGPVTTYKPGTGGFPATGSRFGYNAR
ncbi:trypsin-like serine protease [Streptomyces sp. TRM66268-LWL]|uniref:Trypsin-like serine protease n=1 Tax=Streptomyces polyasparticus TaxID=2767826 RepID=A0ABR7SQ79_9ACTN|nr:trypsin-like serine protease [Streptomyces polyasparticus]MBC9717652.1 trypsin-like serine protease [Streptomyces polyasparticus]